MFFICFIIERGRITKSQRTKPIKKKQQSKSEQGQTDSVNDGREEREKWGTRKARGGETREGTKRRRRRGGKGEARLEGARRMKGGNIRNLSLEIRQNRVSAFLIIESKSKRLRGRNGGLGAGRGSFTGGPPDLAREETHFTPGKKGQRKKGKITTKKATYCKFRLLIHFKRNVLVKNSFECY